MVINVNHLNYINQTKKWAYNEEKNYNWCIGEKVYIKTIWDDNYINIKNYGIVLDINETYISLVAGKHKNYDIPRILHYSHKEINNIFIKCKSISIKKLYRDIKNENIDLEYKKELIKKLLKDNFFTI